MKYTHKNIGTCSQSVSFDLNNGVVTNVAFERGCNGNTKGIGLLCEGMQAEEIIKRLEGNTCGPRNTSCPDQLAKALKEALASEAK